MIQNFDFSRFSARISRGTTVIHQIKHANEIPILGSVSEFSHNGIDQRDWTPRKFSWERAKPHGRLVAN